MKRPHLRALAARFGILPAYVDQEGVRREPDDATRVALLAAMGLDAATEKQALLRLREDEAAVESRLLAPVCVTSHTQQALINLAPFRGSRGPLEWHLQIRAEDGEVIESNGDLHLPPGAAPVAIPLPPRLRHGYHDLTVLVSGRNRQATAGQRLIVTPGRCPTPASLLGGRRVFGLLANLYTLRSRRNWGVGDLQDLRDLVDWSAEIGAAFTGINPLHAVPNRGPAVGPYSPSSRLYRNVIYLDVPSIPELAQTPAARQIIASAVLRAQLAELRSGERIAYETVSELKLEVLRLLHQTFVRRHDGHDTPRGRAYREYRREEGEALVDFATFVALQEHFVRLRRGSDWRGWPVPYRRRNSREVAEFRRRHATEVDFHCYLQFELDRQLATIAATARRQGMPIGIYQDLALGSAGGESDTWSFGGIFLDGARIGAPPDDYNAEGQNWDLPPLDPRRLAATGYAYFQRVVRACLRHSGALRIDHVMGLVRQYWIPNGFPGSAGAYVAFPADDLFGILALESTRANALVIGEDLGTVPPELPALLRRWGVLSTRVLYFERDRRGGFRSGRSYPRAALVTANTHDLAPLAGFWSGRDLELRRSLGLLVSDADLRAAQAARDRERKALWNQLRRTRGVGARGTAPSSAALTDAVHAFLAATPAELVGISLDDLAGESEPVNVPGVAMDRHPSWSRRMTRTIESLRTDPAARRALAPLRRRRMH